MTTIMSEPESEFEVVRKPIVKVGCGRGRCRGVLMRIDLSRLEDGLGHEGFACDSCGRRVKYVPQCAARSCP